MKTPPGVNTSKKLKGQFMNINIRIEKAKDNSDIPIINDYSIHSKYQPVEEGNRLVHTLISRNLPAAVPVVVYGLGFAYHIMPLINHFDHIYVVESLLPLINALQNIPNLSPVLDKITLISDIAQTPYLPDHETISLRSEFRWQEDFFQAVQAQLLIKKSEYTIKADELRILIDYPVYGGSATTAEYVRKAFSGLSCTVEVMDNAIANPMLQYILQMEQYQETMAKKLTQILTDLLWEHFQRFKPHILFCLAQAPIEPEIIKAIRQCGTIVVFWFVEDFRRFPYWQDVCQYVDYFFVIQKGEFDLLLNQNSIARALFLPMASSSDFSHYATEDPTDPGFYSSDVSFMGAAFINRVHFFNQLQPFNLKLWGTGWHQFDQFKALCPLKDKRISIAESVKIYQNTRINLNLHSSMDHELFNSFGDFVNPRTFEILACNAFQLVDDSPAVREFFIPDTDLVVFCSLEEAIDKIKYYLIHENQRKKIALNGYNKVISRHTYQHRMKYAIDLITTESAILRSRVEAENRNIEQVKKALNDPLFDQVINTLSPALRNSPKSVFSHFKQNGLKTSPYKTFFTLLETFFTGE